MNRIDLEKMLIEIYSALDVVIDTMIEKGLMTEEQFRQQKQKAEEEETEKFYSAMCSNYLGKLDFIRTKLSETKDDEKER